MAGSKDQDRRMRIAALLRKLADGVETGHLGDMWDILNITEEEHANLPGVLRDLATEQCLIATADQVHQNRSRGAVGEALTPQVKSAEPPNPSTKSAIPKSVS